MEAHRFGIGSTKGAEKENLNTIPGWEMANLKRQKGMVGRR